MGKIQIIRDKKLDQIKYTTILPKNIMEDLAIEHGDYLLLKSAIGNEITFKLKRKGEIEAEKVKQKELEIERLKNK